MARRPVLDDKKRAQIAAILSVGCSQVMAAKYVGCAVSTIQRTAERDPQFAREIEQAKCNAELVLVKSIRSAAKKQWRAAAWALERGFPEKYARRGADVVTLEHIGLLVTRFAQAIIQEVPQTHCSTVLKKMDVISRGLGIVLDRKVLQLEADHEPA